MSKYVPIPGRLAVSPEELAAYQAVDDASEIAIKANIDALAVEVARALAAEEVVEGNVEAEVARATAAEGDLTNALDAETDRALAAEAAVAADLSAETTRAQDSEDAIMDALVAEKNRALDAEAVMASASVAGNMSSADKVKLDSYPAALKGASPRYVTPSNPTNLTQTSYRHFGLGSTVNITPTLSGKVRFCIRYFPTAIGTGTALNSYRISYGGGAAPANNATPTGTVVGGVDSGGGAVAVASTPAPVVRNVIVAGLSLNTAYWFDIQGQKQSAYTSMGMSSIEVTLEELPY